MTALQPLQDPNLASGIKRRFLPYSPHTLEALLPLRVRTVVVDELDVTEDAVRADRLRIRPHVVPGWRRVRIVFELANVDEDLSRRAFPDEQPAPLRHLLRVRCRETRLRRAAALERDASGYVGMIELSRDDVDRFVMLEAATVLAEQRPSETSARATERFSWIARSPRWVVEIEETSGPAGGAFDFAWIDFAKPEPSPPYRGEDAGHLAACPDALSHVVIRPNGPLVLVNRRHEAVAAVLQSRGTVGVAARLRDVLLGRVAAEAWRTILIEATAAVDAAADNDDDEMANLGDEHWSTAVLRHAAKSAKCHPDELVTRLRDPNERPGLLFELSESLGRVGSDAVRKLVEEIQKA